MPYIKGQSIEKEKKVKEREEKKDDSIKSLTELEEK